MLVLGREIMDGTDDVFGCKAEPTVEALHPDADYLPLLMN